MNGQLAAKDTVIIINVEIHENDGLFVATSPQFPEINVAHPDLRAIYDDFPNILRETILARSGLEYYVAPASLGQEHDSLPVWAAIPPQVAASASHDIG